ncbi:uncharacterized protein LODBEIA_P53120 [Lodderomyces beijingensis]|uniref:Acid phosphatase n=1 Tax=Lodderomyces beijingensis TaxID=1775926 RepID=A0ABP0ZTV3_9ASCO
MVALSKLLYHGLLLAPQRIFEDVASPQQASVEQFNVINFLGGSAPYKQRSGVGISTDVPETCSVEQVQMISRHGERYPSKGDGVAFRKVLDKLQQYGKNFKGDLSFLNTYEYFVSDDELYEKETSPQNSEGPYAGTSDALRHGAYFRARYKDLFANANATLPVFTTNSGRVYQTAQYFARGALGEEYSEDKVEYVVVDESEKMGANSLTPRYACNTNLDKSSDANSELVDSYDTTYLQNILDRWTKDNPGLNLTKSEVSSLFLWSAFEINVRGWSPFTELFTNEEYIKSGYRTDFGNYYQIGPGNNMSTTVGSAMVAASLKLLQGSSDHRTWLMFTHDTDMEIYFSSMGLIELETGLPAHVVLPNPYNAAEMFPQGGRTYMEKLQCGGQQYVRFIMNDAVVPYPKCTSGIGFSCPLEEFVEIVSRRMAGVSYRDQCNSSVPTELSFFWDYHEVRYDAPLIDQ